MTLRINSLNRSDKANNFLLRKDQPSLLYAEHLLWTIDAKRSELDLSGNQNVCCKNDHLEPTSSSPPLCAGSIKRLRSHLADLCRFRWVMNALMHTPLVTSVLKPVTSLVKWCKKWQLAYKEKDEPSGSSKRWLVPLTEFLELYGAKVTHTSTVIWRRRVFFLPISLINQCSKT